MVARRALRQMRWVSAVPFCLHSRACVCLNVFIACHPVAHHFWLDNPKPRDMLDVPLLFFPSSLPFAFQAIYGLCHTFKAKMKYFSLCCCSPANTNDGGGFRERGRGAWQQRKCAMRFFSFIRIIRTNHFNTSNLDFFSPRSIHFMRGISEFHIFSERFFSAHARASLLLRFRQSDFAFELRLGSWLYILSILADALSSFLTFSMILLSLLYSSRLLTFPLWCRSPWLCIYRQS